MATFNLENVFKENYDTNFVWIIDNFRFQKSYLKTLPPKQSQKHVWKIEISFSGEGNSQISGCLFLKATADPSYYRQYKYGRSQNVVCQLASSNVILSTLIAQLDENGEVGTILGQQKSVNMQNLPEISFSGEIARGKSYPYDSLRLCFCLTEGTQTLPRSHVGLIMPAHVYITSIKVSFVVNEANLSKPNVFATYSNILYCGTVGLENQNKMLRCKIVPASRYTALLYCNVSVFNERGDLLRQLEDWFENSTSNESTFFTKPFKYISGNITLMIEVAVPAEQDEYRFLEEPINSPVKMAAVAVLKECSSSSKENIFKKAEHTLMGEIWAIYNEQKLSDLILRVGNQSFAIHKTVLCARSPVFETMLQSDMKEKKSGVIDIKDATPEIVKSFLNFVYSDKLPSVFNHEEFIHLYSMADKYQVKLLKKKCSDLLKSKIAIGNVCDVLELADMHQDESLRDSSFAFMKSNLDTFFDSGEWKEFLMRKVQLAAAAMHFCLKKK